MDPVVGRQEQVERVIKISGKQTKNNPCLIGEPGVGKTIIVEGKIVYNMKSYVKCRNFRHYYNP